MVINYKSRPDMAEKSALKLYNEGVYAAREGRFKDAVNFYKSALELDPALREACINLGSIYIRARRYKEAHEMLERAWETGGDENLLFNLASLEVHLGRHEEAAAKLNRIIQKNTTFSRARLLLADIHEKAGRSSACEQQLRLIIAAEPEHTKALGAMVYFLLDRRREKEALPLLERLLSLKPADGELKKLRASLKLDSGSVGQSYQEYRQLAREDSGFTDFTESLEKLDDTDRQSLAGLSDQISERKEAVKERIKAVQQGQKEVSQDDLRDLVDLSLMHLFNGEPDEGLKYLFAAKKLKGE